MSDRPLWRWTIGNTIKQGLEILEESVFRALKLYGDYDIDWAICYNGLNDQSVENLQSIVQNLFELIL